MFTCSAVLMVTSHVESPDDRVSFDRWYADDHMPSAKETLLAQRSWRAWNTDNPAIHYAFYEFSSIDDLHEAMASQGIRDLIAEYDSRWPNNVTRSREVLNVAQTLSE